MKIGSVVMFTDGVVTVRCGTSTLRSTYPEFYPPAKTIGTVVEFRENEYNHRDLVKVQWPSSATSKNYIWWCYSEYLLEL